jgi:MFS superfamily sulfate permease-like transporter
VALSGFIELLPVATLTGVLFMVVLSTFQWKTFNILRYGRLSDSGVIVLVTLIAVFFNLAVAIAAGIIFSALVNSWDSGDHIDADIFEKPMLVKRTGHVYKDGTGVEHNEEAGDEEIVMVKYVHVKGSIFFGSARHFINMFSVANDPQTVVIDFKDALIIDHSAVAAIGGITHRFAKVGKRVLLVNLPHKSHGRLHRTGDHAILEKQIILHKDELVSVEQGEATRTSESADDSGEVSEEKKTESVHVTYSGDVGPVDEYHTPKDLQDLQMFNAGAKSVDEEIDHLEEVQGTFEVHEIEGKKGS